MIFIELSNPNPFTYVDGMTIKTQGPQVADIPVIEANSFNECDLGCKYTEKVLAEVGGEYWKNDKSSFLFQKLIATDTIVLNLYKNGVLLSAITDNTYGEYYSSFTAKPLYVGFIIYWENVFNLHGAGKYEIKADRTIIGNSDTIASQCFFLLPYEDEIANGTIRIETYQKGNILSSQFDYTGLLADGWYRSYRINGKLSAPSPKKEVDLHLTQDYITKQVQDQIVNEWDLSINPIPALIGDVLLYDSALANQFLVTDYAKYAYNIYRRVSLYPQEIDKPNEPTRTVLRAYDIKLTDKQPNHIKRN